MRAIALCLVNPATDWESTSHTLESFFIQRYQSQKLNRYDSKLNAEGEFQPNSWNLVGRKRRTRRGQGSGQDSNNNATRIPRTIRTIVHLTQQTTSEAKVVIQGMSTRTTKRCISTISGKQVTGLKGRTGTELVYIDKTVVAKRSADLQSTLEEMGQVADANNLIPDLTKRLIELKTIASTKQYKHAISIRSTSKRLHSVNWKQIAAGILHLAPPQMSLDRPAPIVFCSAQKLGTILQNHKHGIRGDPMMEARKPCKCAQIGAEFKRFNHVCTADIDVLLDMDIRARFRDALRELMPRGANYTPQIPEKLLHVLEGLKIDLDNWCRKKAEQFDIPFPVFFPLIRTFLQKARAQLETMPFDNTTAPSSVDTYILSENGRKHVQQLQAKYVITGTDKAATNFSISCRVGYAQRLIAHALDLELKDVNWKDPLAQKYEPFEIVDTITEQQMVKHIRKQFNNIDIQTKHMTLPYMYIQPKMHKIGERCITAAHKCVSTHAGKILVQALKTVKSSLKKKARAEYQETGINWFWSIESSNEITNILRTKNNRNEKYAAVTTFDIAGFYEEIPHGEAVRIINGLIDELFDANRRRPIMEINLRDETTRFTSAKYAPKPWIQVRKQQLQKLIELKITQNFAMIGSMMVKKRKGIPMGDPESPLLADLFAIALERRFMKNLNTDRAQELSQTTRKIDDILFLTEIDDNITERIYPKEWFTLKKGNNNHMDITIYADSKGNWAWKPYDKRDAFDFDPIRFIDARSATPPTVLRGTLIGKLHSIHRRSAEAVDFVIQTGHVVDELMTLYGWNKRLVSNTLYRFLDSERPYRISRADVSPITKVIINKTLCKDFEERNKHL